MEGELTLGCKGCDEKRCNICFDYDKWTDKHLNIEAAPKSGGKSPSYGTYYGNLVKFSVIDDKVLPDDITFCEFDDTKGLIKSFYDAGVEEVIIDVEEGNDYGETLLFKTSEKTDFRKVMVICTKMRPHEFDEITPYHFRMWYD